LPAFIESNVTVTDPPLLLVFYKVCVGWPRLLALILILGNAAFVAWGQTSYVGFYFKISNGVAQTEQKGTATVTNLVWTSKNLYDGNMWAGAQMMLGDQLYSMSWSIVILAGIFPYLQLLSLAFVAVTSLGLLRRDWMLKWLAGAGRWALLDIYIVIALLAMVKIDHAGGSQPLRGLQASVITSYGMLALGGSLVLAQIFCCIFEVSHAATEEVLLFCGTHRTLL